MSNDRGDETHTKINAQITTRIGRKTVRYLLAFVIGGGALGGAVGLLPSAKHSCHQYERELVQWRHWAEDRMQKYPKNDKAGFWAGAPITLNSWDMLNRDSENGD